MHRHHLTHRQADHGYSRLNRRVWERHPTWA